MVCKGNICGFASFELRSQMAENYLQLAFLLDLAPDSTVVSNEHLLQTGAAFIRTAQLILSLRLHVLILPTARCGGVRKHRDG